MVVPVRLGRTGATGISGLPGATGPRLAYRHRSNWPNWRRWFRWLIHRIYRRYWCYRGYRELVQVAYWDMPFIIFLKEQIILVIRRRPPAFLEAGDKVSFPKNGTGITAVGVTRSVLNPNTDFVLTFAGIYEIIWQEALPIQLKNKCRYGLMEWSYLTQ